MEPKIPWQYLDDRFLIDIPEEPGKEKIEPGSRSQERENQTLREQSVLPTLYFSRNTIPDSPAEPDQVEMVPYSEPFNIPLEDISGDKALIYNYINNIWPEPKGEQPSIPDFPLGMNNIMSIPNMMLPQPQFPGYGNNQMNWGMASENMMRMGPPANNIFIPPNQIMMNNQMYMGDQLPQQSQPLPLQQQSTQQQYHQVPVQENQWMGPPGPPMQHDQHLGQLRPYNNNGPPPHFERGGGSRDHTRWDNPRSGNYDSYRGKINRNNQRDTNDKMEPKIPWQCLDDRFLIDISEEPGKKKIEPGSRSQEKKERTFLDQLVPPILYFSKNMIPDSPAEPDQMEIVPYSEPLNIPLEDMSGDIYNYADHVWPQSKGEQPSIPNFPLGMNNIMSIPNMMLPQPQFPGYGNNQMNWGMAPENMMGMGPPTNNIFIPPNQIMMNNQMYMDDPFPHTTIPWKQQYHQGPVQEDQWVGPSGPFIKRYQYWGQHQPYNNNRPPPNFERDGGVRSDTGWDYPRGGNYDSYRGKINHNNQRGNKGGPYSCRGGHSGNGRASQLCKYYLKHGFCKNPNCVFLHTKRY